MELGYDTVRVEPGLAVAAVAGDLELGLLLLCTVALMLLMLSFDERKKLATLCGIVDFRRPLGAEIAAIRRSLSTNASDDCCKGKMTDRNPGIARLGEPGCAARSLLMDVLV